MRILNLFTALLVLLFFSQCIHPKSVTRYATDQDVDHFYSGLYVDQTCRENEGYVPDSNSILESPIRYVRCVVHFLNSSNEENNYKKEKAVKFSKQLIWECNKRWMKNPKMFLPVGNTTPAPPKRIGLKLENNLLFEGDNGIYYHLDDSLYYFVHKGKNRNSGNREVIKKYVLNNDSILNIFVLAHHPDSILSSTYNAWGQGITLGNHIKVAGQWAQKMEPWQLVNLTNHEIGHVLGLSHTWSFSDGCDDTPKNPNCWNYTNDGPCKENVSNNMMDYNAYQIALSPCQLGRIHRNFSSLNRRQRKLLNIDWCQLDTTVNIHIKSKKHWKGAKDIKNNIIIEPGAILKISCRVSMPEHSTIIVRAGGLLILERALLHNSCNLLWNGIQIEKEGDIEGRVVLLEDSEIINIVHPISE